jgi:hypothetical protein
MLNEHHQTATCVDPAAPLMLAALARLAADLLLSRSGLRGLVGIRPGIIAEILRNVSERAHVH